LCSHHRVPSTGRPDERRRGGMRERDVTESTPLTRRLKRVIYAKARAQNARQ